MVFQSYALYPHKSVAENIASFALRGRRSRDQRARGEGGASCSGIAGLLDRRRASCAAASASASRWHARSSAQPQVFLMDEPLSNLDAQLRMQMRVEIERCSAAGVTTLYVTHDQVEAMTMADPRRPPRRPASTGRHAAELYDRPVNLFVAGFIGSPPMNLAEVTLEQANGNLVVPLGGTKIPLREGMSGLEKWAGRNVIVGLRPEDLHGPRPGAPTDGKVTLPAKVDRVEALGASLLVYFGVDASAAQSAGVAAALGAHIEEVTHLGRSGSEFCATFEPRTGVRVGDNVTVSVDVDRLHFFDPESEDALTP